MATLERLWQEQIFSNAATACSMTGSCRPATTCRYALQITPVGHGGPCRSDTDKFRCYPNRVANIARPRRCIREWPLRARRAFADHLPGRARRREERQSSKRWRLPLLIRTLSCSWRLAPLLRSTSSYLRVRVNALLLRKRLALMRVHSRRSRTSVGRWNRKRSAVSARELRHQPVIMRRRIRSLQTK